MALVCHAKRDCIEQVQKNDIKGPGYYELTNQIHQTTNKAPFNSKIYRNFQQDNEIKQQKSLFAILQKTDSLPSFYNDSIKIKSQNTQSSSAFQSKINRFQTTQESNIGPGSYNTECTQKSFNIKKNNKKIQEIVKLDKQKNHQYLQDSFNKYSEEKQQQKTECKQKIKNQIADWKKVNYKRFYENKKETSEKIGPGFYQLDQQKSYDKNNFQFISKSQRLFDQNPGEIKNQNIYRQLFQKALDQDIYDINLQQQQAEYLQESLPGPGNYNIRYQDKNENLQSFQNQQRFQNQESTVGPGDYNINQKKNNLNYYSSVKKRFEYSINQNPGPGQYEPNYQDINFKGLFRPLHKQNFGNSIERNLDKYPVYFIQYKEVQQNQNYYLNPDIISFDQYKNLINNVQDSNFKSETERIIFPQNKNKCPEFQDNQYNYISQKAENVKKAPIKQNSINKIKDEKENKYNDKHIMDQVLKSKEPISQENQPFSKRAPRFQQIQQQQTDRYIPLKDKWNKQSHNIIYSYF